MSREGGLWVSPAMIVALVFKPLRLPNLIYTLDEVVTGCLLEVGSVI